MDSIRDWGYAPEFVEGMWRILQASEPSDYVLATGVGYTVRNFLDFSFSEVQLDWRKFVRFDERFLRPTEVNALVGDFSKANKNLGWKPQTFAPELARLMVKAELINLQK